MRYIAVQFETMLSDEPWRKNADRANKIPRLLADSLSGFPNITLAYPISKWSVCQDSRASDNSSFRNISSL